MQTSGDESFERLRFEHELINRYLTWLLSSQTILFAAYGVALGTAKPGVADFFLKVTAISGAVIAGLIFIGVISGILAKLTVWKDSQKRQFGVRTWITYLALIPDTFLPLVFAIAWIFILCQS
jgi:DMSO/TMAO reductase YedYZ heme-binding membrane subunit